ncbi:hypothetical protein I6A84_31260 [Frankia sp. CNm7]|uniref:Uncharacterized protein n=1 Tax=Frankia nepalensis TaxID=1836974 RepID=A0A937R6N0_9ACTN|nr:hypothetical protein [Frankia nepalensis]MBL7498710.1 hypothetical protein [Frankia nepalensis]MBL7508425.1 hypothetical protein [Frankia nepalensis]MBL7522442.1 hypothetical protein [Frankia nepalensis]MBL7626256.1 hypothetical protein [Frankia nepalensis]
MTGQRYDYHGIVEEEGKSLAVEHWQEHIRTLLVDTRLVSIGRALNLMIIAFSPGGDLGDESVRLHVQCPMRFRHRDSLLIGSGDLAFERPETGEKRYDTRAAEFNSVLKGEVVRVEDVRHGPAGSLSVECSGGLFIEVFPATLRHVEAWRVLRVGDEHFGYPPDLI